MRIAVVGPPNPDSFSDNICDVLKAEGHDVFALGPAIPRFGKFYVDQAIALGSKLPGLEERLQRRIVSRCQKVSPELVITVQSLLPETVRSLKSLGCQVALWFPDHVGSLARHEMFVAPYDAIFFKQPRVVERARAMLDAPVHYLPEACNPRWHRPIDDLPRGRSVVVAGNMYPWRTRLLERLMGAGVPITIFGDYWPRWIDSPELKKLHTWKYIAREEKAREFRAAGLVLNNLHPSEIDGYNCRLFEATGCGAAVLTEQRPELEDFFVPGEEVVSYTDFDELVDRARWLLDHPDEGRLIGDAAVKRAHAEHTYSHRFKDLFRALS